MIIGLFPGGSANDKPYLTAAVGRGDITIEGLQGLKSPADSGQLQVDLNAGGGGNIKLIVNANGFLGVYINIFSSSASNVFLFLISYFLFLISYFLFLISYFLFLRAHIR
jgi:hypothetical protein